MFALVVSLLLSPAPTPPPAPFLKVLEALPGSGFHVDSRMPAAGYQTIGACPSRSKRGEAFCAGQTGRWRSVIVGDAKVGGQAVVQELWVFVYPDSAIASAAAEAADDMTFSKHPWTAWSSGRALYFVEGRFRFPTPRKTLSAFVGSVLKRYAPKLVEF